MTFLRKKKSEYDIGDHGLACSHIVPPVRPWPLRKCSGDSVAPPAFVPLGVVRRVSQPWRFLAHNARAQILSPMILTKQ